MTILNRIKAQALVETALCMPLFLFIVFLLIEVSFFLMEFHVSQYAAFMAARSYQVYGNKTEGSQNKKIYQAVAEDILEHSIPYRTRKNMSIIVDSHSFSQNTNNFKINDWKKKKAFYGIDMYSDSESSLLAHINQIDKPRFGLLKLSFDSQLKLPFIENFMNQTFIVPYRLEERQYAHLSP